MADNVYTFPQPEEWEQPVPVSRPLWTGGGTVIYDPNQKFSVQDLMSEKPAEVDVCKMITD